MTDIPNIERRRAQGQIVKPIYDELVAEIGEERAVALIARAVARSVEVEAKAAREATLAEGENPMVAFTESFRRTYERRGLEAGLEVEVTRADDDALDFTVKRCRFVEVYHELGLGHLAATLSCNRDGDFATAFDPSIELDRPQTIAGGADTCLFRYRLRPED
ncbi:MAG: L-2-amino-thiazoline-4-carboxylic acid hydrolase [Rhodobacterales bacterium]|nr:L-2-amino-thiazoline-4-carboxylic acid hydrolase [Rhodobacterales bacterium]